jgi:galactose-1-phosphate uridylyltransferase
MAIRTSGTNSYSQHTVNTITDGEKMLKKYNKDVLFCSTNTANCSVKMAGPLMKSTTSEITVSENNFTMVNTSFSNFL